MYIQTYIIQITGPLALLRTTCTCNKIYIRVYVYTHHKNINSNEYVCVPVFIFFFFFFWSSEGSGGSISWLGGGGVGSVVQGNGRRGGSRKTKDLRRLPRGVRAGGLPASVHSSAGGRRGLPRWRVRGSGGGDDGVL